MAGSDTGARPGRLHIAAAEVVEVLPAYHHGQITAHAAANMAWEIMSLIAWHRLKQET